MALLHKIKTGNGWRLEIIGRRIKVSTSKREYGDYRLLQEPYCKICAYPNISTSKCPWHWNDAPLGRTYAVGAYIPSRAIKSREDLLSQHILGLKKFSNYAVPLGLAMALCVENFYSELLKFNILVPVPKHSSELKANGSKIFKYNQAAELAKILGQQTGITVSECLCKTRAHSQRNLN